jgi:hypothetical protein
MGVSLVLSGHDHIYNRTEMYGGERPPAPASPMWWAAALPAPSTTTPTRNGRPWQDVVYDENNPVFSVLKLRDGVLSFEAYALKDGESVLVDQFAVLKRGDDAAMLAAAQSIVEGAESLGTLPQAEAADAEAAAQALRNAVRALPGFGVTDAEVQVEIADFVEASAGGAENYAGTDGSFTYTITLTLGGGTAVLEPRTGVITAHGLRAGGGDRQRGHPGGRARNGDTPDRPLTTGLLPADAKLAYQWTRDGGEEPVGAEEGLYSDRCGHRQHSHPDRHRRGRATKAALPPTPAEIGIGPPGRAGRGARHRTPTRRAAPEPSQDWMPPWEYKGRDADEWTGAEGETAEGLAPGNYRVRYAGTDTQAPSAAVCRNRF